MLNIKPGEMRILANGNKWSYGYPALVVGCEGGYLIAFQTGDAGIYDEISIDFVSNDKLIQLATVGRTEHEAESDWHKEVEPDYQPMHVFAYDGIEEDVAHIQYVTVSDDSMWYVK